MKDGLQARLVDTKRQHILDAAAGVFAERGFHAASVRDVAEAAGVSPGSIYNYFANKEALLLGLFDLMTARANDDSPTAPTEGCDPDPRSFLRATLRHPLATLTRSNTELFRVVLSEAVVNRGFAERFRAQILEPMYRSSALLLERASDGGAAASERGELQARLLSGLVLGMVLLRVMNDERIEERWDDLPDALADLILDGLGGAPK